MTLDREEHCAARGFFLTAWNGTTGYTFDRILRGKTHIEAACLSLVGSTQPGRLAEYIRRANEGGAGDDGLIQRFGLLVWPDQDLDWREVDRYPNGEAREAAWQTFDRLDQLDPDRIRAERDQFEPIPFLRFDDKAQGFFSEWRADLEKRLRASDMSPALESHLAKYRKLVPTLALVNDLADGEAGRISETALIRALALAEYLETHARRAYGAGSERGGGGQSHPGAHPQGRPDGRLRRKRHPTQGMVGPDRQRADQSRARTAADLDWIAPETTATTGRPRTVYRINPRSLR